MKNKNTGRRVLSGVILASVASAGFMASPSAFAQTPDFAAVSDVINVKVGEMNGSVNVLENDKGTTTETVVALLDADGKATDTVSVADEGTWSVAGGGEVTFTPEDGFTGQTKTAVSYQITEGENTAKGSLVAYVLEAGVANDDSAEGTVAAPIRIPVLNNDAPAEGAEFDLATLTLVKDSAPVESVETEAGIFTVDGSEIVFTPAEGVNAATITADYVVKDTEGTEYKASATVMVVGDDSAETPADAPTADAAEGVKGQPVTLDVLANDGTGVAGDSLALVDAEENGAIVVKDMGTWTVAGGKVVFTPEAEFVGEAVAKYSVKDAAGAEHIVDMKVTITDDGTGETPNETSAVTDKATTGINTPITVDILANDILAEGATWNKDSLMLVDKDGNPAKTVTNESGVWAILDGKVFFTPAEDWTGITAMEYVVTDSENVVATNEVTITVTADDVMDDEAAAVADVAETKAGAPVTIDVLANDEGDFDASTLKLLDGLIPTDSYKAMGGTFTVENGKVVFTPDADFTGKVPTVHYTVSTTDGEAVKSTIDVTVTAADDETPIFDHGKGVDDSVTTPFETPVTVDVLKNDPVADGATWDMESLKFLDADGKPADEFKVDGGVFTIVDGKVVFTPATGFSGEVKATYIAMDSAGMSVSADVTVTVSPADEQKPDEEKPTPAPTPEPEPEDKDKEKPSITTGGDPSEGGNVVAGAAGLMAAISAAGVMLRRKFGKSAE